MGSLLWVAAVSTFGIGDVVTTHIGMQQTGVYEAHPLSDLILESTGSGGMVVWKAATILGFYVVSQRYVPEEWRMGVPLGLTILGVLIVWNNLRVIQAAGGL